MSIFSFLKNFKSSPKAKIICLVFYLFGTVLLFISSSNLSYSWIEQCSYEMTRIVDNNRNKDYVSVLVESKDDSEKHVASPSNEFFLTYGAFGEANAFYAGVMNGDKSHMAKIEEIETDENISFLYAYNFHNYAYKDHFIHEFYPIELKYRGLHDYGSNYYFCYISESQADSLLEQKFLEKTEVNYKKLLGEVLSINVGDSVYKYTIGNIYLEKNYYYDAVRDSIGSFIISGGKPLGNIRSQACYFMTKHIFKNKFFLNRIFTEYHDSDYSKWINEYNLQDLHGLSSINKKLNTDINSISAKDPVFCFVIILAVLMCLVSGSIFVLKIMRNDVLSIFLFIIALFAPYMVFFLIFLGTSNILLFNGAACVVELFCLMSLLIEAIIVLFRKAKK